MKLLVRDNQNNLKWEEVIYKNGVFYTPDESHGYDPFRIYAVKDDNRNKTVICSGCGAEIRNTPSAIKAHRNMINKPNKCFECHNLRPQNETVLSQKYVLNEDGTYNESTKRTVKLTCGIGWRYRDINSEEARENCRYARCENATFKNIEDFWTEYPGAFDEFITIDRIIEAGYRTMYKSTNEIEFVLKGRVNLAAFVNNQGICYKFVLRHRNHRYQFRYSKKYDKVWVDNYYRKELSALPISSDTEEAIMKKIRTLYK